MNNLKDAAKKVLEAWDWDYSEPRSIILRERMNVLKRVLAEDVENERPNMYDLESRN